MITRTIAAAAIAVGATIAAPGPGPTGPPIVAPPGIAEPAPVNAGNNHCTVSTWTAFGTRQVRQRCTSIPNGRHWVRVYYRCGQYVCTRYRSQNGSGTVQTSVPASTYLYYTRGHTHYRPR